MRYFTEEYFKEIERRLLEDSTWQQSTKGIKTTILLTATDKSESFQIKVEEGVTIVNKVDPTTQSEFTFEGKYEDWTKVAKGEVDLQSAVLKGMLKFKGSITKILFYKDRFVRIADVIKSTQMEF